MVRRLPLALGTLARETWLLLPFAVVGAVSMLRGRPAARIGGSMPQRGTVSPRRGTFLPQCGILSPRRGMALALLLAAAIDLALVAVYDIGDAEGYYFPALLRSRSTRAWAGSARSLGSRQEDGA